MALGPAPAWGDDVVLSLLPVCSVIGVAFAAYLWAVVARIKVARDGSAAAEAAVSLLGDTATKCAQIQAAITEGAQAFLATEYQLCGAFMVGFAVIIFAFLASVHEEDGGSGGSAAPPPPPSAGSDGVPKIYNAIFSTVSFILGASTSMICGYLGMSIATYANARTALEARKGVGPAFQAAFRSGAVMGFLLTSLGLLVLYIAIQVFRHIYPDNFVGTKALYEAITGYGLGGSSIALFGRVGGGIYTKAADVGADLVGKVEKDIPEDDPRNPAVIADNVGDNVGDIAGMGADLFGSFAESTCAALVVAGYSSLAEDGYTSALLYPLVITATSVLVCLVTTLIATDFAPASKISGIETALKVQLVVSTGLMAVATYVVTVNVLPSHFYLTPGDAGTRVTNLAVFGSVLSGLIAGLIIGITTEYYTSNTYSEVRQVADACRTGAATNIIFGLALGYKSCIVPTVCLAAVAFTSYELAGFYGVACGALGMLGTLSTCLAIDAYGPIADNAGGIAEMAGMGEDIRERTDALDAAGNTTAAIGKGFAIGSAGLVSLALFGAFVTRAGIKAPGSGSVLLLDIKCYVGIMLGAMLPYWFSAMTMKSVGEAALAMVEEVRRQFNTIPGIMEGTAQPDYRRCVAISTQSSLRQMVAPGALVMLSPVITGVLFGTQTLAGLLIGSLVSGIQIAVSASNTGGAWDNAKKYLEAGRNEHARSIGGKGTEAHKAAVVGDTVGDPLKDTSGPSNNIVMKLMAVESLVFAPFFAHVTPDGLLFQFF